MSRFKEHRVYSYMSQPFRVMGLTLDELSSGILFFVLFLLFEGMTLKILFLVSSPASVIVLKRLKKLVEGFSLKSFLHWSLGIRFGLSESTPPSWKRRIWG